MRAAVGLHHRHRAAVRDHGARRRNRRRTNPVRIHPRHTRPVPTRPVNIRRSRIRRCGRPTRSRSSRSLPASPSSSSASSAASWRSSPVTSRAVRSSEPASKAAAWLSRASSSATSAWRSPCSRLSRSSSWRPPSGPIPRSARRAPTRVSLRARSCAPIRPGRVRSATPTCCCACTRNKQPIGARGAARSTRSPSPTERHSCPRHDPTGCETVGGSTCGAASSPLATRASRFPTRRAAFGPSPVGMVRDGRC